ncbi:uncharacterized protein N7498_004693 [Penicillium cinerascens]|uniref:Uncharacterized protein n=1 Tax=Penicillium cinerascens TaxID=70096 RepID=A0A9W9MM73_9EURO|nr:uncharacterized protein N7498_004693 [Penicillium cinerascens]KAJ5203814.1 hypothetical protein N7498_004693 [Penicillium cinerascens]
MAALNTIPAASYVGTIDGISVVWGPNAIANLPTNAEAYKVKLNVLKSATEKVAVACARRIGKTSVRILYEAILNPGFGHIHEYPNCLAGARFTTRPPTPRLVKQCQTHAIAQFPSTQEVPRPTFT